MMINLEELAKRVENEELTSDLNSDVAAAFGWRLYTTRPGSFWYNENRPSCWSRPPDILNDLSVIASLLPVGWYVESINKFNSGNEWGVVLRTIDWMHSVESLALSEERARIAASLRALKIDTPTEV